MQQLCNRQVNLAAKLYAVTLKSGPFPVAVFLPAVSLGLGRCSTRSRASCKNVARTTFTLPYSPYHSSICRVDFRCRAGLCAQGSRCKLQPLACFHPVRRSPLRKQCLKPCCPCIDCRCQSFDHRRLRTKQAYCTSERDCYRNRLEGMQTACTLHSPHAASLKHISDTHFPRT